MSDDNLPLRRLRYASPPAPLKGEQKRVPTIAFAPLSGEQKRVRQCLKGERKGGSASAERRGQCSLRNGTYLKTIKNIFADETEAAMPGASPRPTLVQWNHMGFLQRRGALRNAEDSVPYRTWFNHITLYKWWVPCLGQKKNRPCGRFF